MADTPPSAHHEHKVLACLDPAYDPIWGHVVSFHPFELEAAASNSELDSVVAPRQTTQAERQARGQLGVCAPEEEWELRQRECDQDFVGYIPSHSHHRAMRSMHEFEDDEMITSVDGLERVCASLAQSHGKSAQRTSLLWGRRRSSMRASGASSEAAAMQPCQRERIVFLCIEDARLEVQLAAQIGPTLKALSNLEVVILKGVGLSSLEKVQGTTRLLYLDLSGNNLFEVDEVERFLRECESLVWADFDGNPCLKDPEAEPKMLAVSSWTLRHLNQQPVEIRRKVAAIMKHGDAAARCTLCDQVWDAQVCSTHAVSSKRVVDPVRLERLELPGAGLSVFHVGLFSSLTLLDLSGNQLTVLRGRGLKQLVHLRWLSLSHNHLSDPWELTPLLALRAISWLVLAPQRLPVDALTSAGPQGRPGALYRRLVVLLTLDSEGSQEQAGLNCLDRLQHARALSLDAPSCPWKPVTIDERLDALKEVYQQRASAACDPAQRADAPTGEGAASRNGAERKDENVWVGAPESWLQLRQYVLGYLARSVPSLAPTPSSWPCPQQMGAFSRLRHAGSSSGCHSVAAAVGFLSQDKTAAAGALYQTHGVTEEQVLTMLDLERQRASMFARVGQRAALDSRQLATLTHLALNGCGLSQVYLHGMPSLVVLDLSDNAPLRRIECLDALPKLQHLLLHRNPMLCGIAALSALMAQLLHLAHLRTLTLPFHMLDMRADVDLGGSYDQWHLLSEKIMLRMMGSNPLQSLNGRRVSISDRVHAYQDILLHQGSAACEHLSQPLAHVLPSVEFGSTSGVQVPCHDGDMQQVQDYLANLVLITSVSKHCICSRRTTWGSTCQRTALNASPADDCADRLCQHKASSYVMAGDLLPGLRYNPTCVVELSDTHGFGLTSDSLAKALPLFCNLRRLNLSRNRLASVCRLGLVSMVHLEVLDVSSNLLRDHLSDLGVLFDALPRLVALMLRNNPCMRTRAERMRLMQSMHSLRTVSCTLRYLDSEITMDERVQAWAQATACSPDKLELLKQQALLVLLSPPGVPSGHVEELDLSSRGLRAVEGSLLSPFVSLRRLMLQDNALRSLAGAQLEQLTSLQVLDLRRNSLSDLTHLIRTVEALSNLQQLGVAGNVWQCPPAAETQPISGFAAGEDHGRNSAETGEHKVRGMVLQKLVNRYREDARYPLRFLDDWQIPVQHIVDACRLDSVAGSKLTFVLTVARQMQDCVEMLLSPPGVRVEQLAQLDLSDRELSHVDFSGMPLLESVLLQHNRLDDDALVNSALHKLTRLQHLDVSHNKIQSCDAVGEVIAAGHRAGCLHSVSLSQNPCFPSDNLYAHRVALLASKPVIASLGCAGATLTLLNGSPISVAERVDAVEASLRMLHAASPSARQAKGTYWGRNLLLSALPVASSTLQTECEPSDVDEQNIRDTVEDVRLTLQLELHRCSYGSTALCLSNLHLGSLRALCDYIYLVVLEVRGNEVCKLEPISSLPRLASLDVRDNKVDSTDQGLRALSKCDELRHLFLERMSSDWITFVATALDQYPQPSFAARDTVSTSFTLEVFRRLPALSDCDGDLNPAPLAGFQWTALMHLKRNFGVGPNSITNVDLSDRSIEKQDFYSIRDWLAFLPVTDLNIDQNPLCISIQNYRYVLINDVRTLQRLNGCNITDEERANAFKKVQEMKNDLIYNPPNIDSLKLDNVGRAYSKMASRQGGGASSANHMSIWGSQIESWFAFVQVQSFIGSFPNVPWHSLPLYEEIRNALAPFVQNIEYVLPNVECICFWGYVKSAVLILTPVIAWRIFKLNIDWERYEHQILHHFRPALMRKLAQWAAACMLALVIALAIDCIDCTSIVGIKVAAGVNATADQENGEMCSGFQDSGHCQAWKRLLTLQRWPRATMGWLVTLVSFNTIVLLLWLAATLLARYKNRKGHDKGFMFESTGMIKKCGMVLISMSYLPICNILLDNVRPFEIADDNSTQLKWGYSTGGCMVVDGRANEQCPDYPRGRERIGQVQYIMFVVSLVFAIVYMVGIPMYLVHHVREAVSVLDRNNPRHVRLFQEVRTAERKRSWRGFWLTCVPQFLLPLIVSDKYQEEEVKRKRLILRANALYAEAVCDFDDARSALYCSYKWNYKYFKMVAIGERVLILLLAFFLSDPSIKLWIGHDAFEELNLQQLELQKLLTALTTAIFLTVSLSWQPFSDWQDGLIDGMCRVTNMCNAIVVFLASKPSIFFAYKPFKGPRSMQTCSKHLLNHSTVQELGLSMAGIQSDLASSNLNITATGDEQDAKNGDEDAIFCEFLRIAGYCLGVLNIACFVLIMVGLLISPVRWWLQNRRAKKAREEEFELHEKFAMHRRRSSILATGKKFREQHSYTHGSVSPPVRTIRKPHQASSAERQSLAHTGESPCAGDRTMEVLKRAVSFGGQVADRAGAFAVSRSSRVSLSVLSSNDLADRGVSKEEVAGKGLARSKSVAKAYRQIADILIG